ncbi:MAG: acetyl-coenzyme A synthetase N-terminal domain-containing protein, partial [Betaproteobacteria bacterium]
MTTGVETLSDFHRRSITDPAGFWAEQASLIDWNKPFERVLDDTRLPFVRWFVGGETNLCHNAVDRHLPTLGDKPALIFVSTETDQERVYTFSQLHAEIMRMAAVMQSLGVKR